MNNNYNFLIYYNYEKWFDHNWIRNFFFNFNFKIFLNVLHYQKQQLIIKIKHFICNPDILTYFLLAFHLPATLSI